MTEEYALHLLNQLMIGASVDAKPIIPQYELAQALNVVIKALEQQPCDDCISRENILDYIAKLLSGYLYEEERERLEDFTAYIAEMPSVIPQRPNGKWNFIGDQMFECSSCKRAYTQNQFEELRIYTTDDLLPKYCPNCGSYNGGGEE